MKLFSFKSIDGETWPYLRAPNLLLSLLEGSLKVNAVYVGPGHIAVVYKDNTLLRVFDNAPLIHRSVVDEEAKFSNPESFQAPDDADNCRFLCVSTPSPIVNLQFERNGQKELNFIVFTQDGNVYIWFWDEIDWKWKWSNQTFLPSTEKSPPTTQATYSDKHGIMLWQESTGKIYTRTAEHIPPATKKDRPKLEVRPQIHYIETIGDVNKFIPAMDGVWFVTNISVHLWTYRSHIMHKLEIDNSSPRKEEETNAPSLDSRKKAKLRDIYRVALHPITQELVVLESSGRVFVCNSELSATHLCTIQHSKLQEGLNDIFVHNQTLGLVFETSVTFYDIKCGALLGEEEMPSSLADGYKGMWITSYTVPRVTQLGFWGKSLWELIPPTAAKMAEAVVNHKKGDNSVVNNCAISVCKDWSLNRAEAKHALDLTINQSDDEQKKKAAQALLPHLQSPALILPLLATTNNSKFLKEQLNNFISVYHNTAVPQQPSFDLSNQESARIAARTSFHYHTPLNNTIVPKLEKYLQLSVIREQQAASSKPVTTIYNSTVDDYSPEQLLELPRAKLELFAFKQPEKLLPKLELALGIDVDHPTTLSPLLFHPEESVADLTTSGGRPNQHLFFELMCRLYSTQKPEFLSTFVQMVTIATSTHSSNSLLSSSRSSSANMNAGSLLSSPSSGSIPNIPEGLTQQKFRNHYLRALSSVPPVLSATSSSVSAFGSLLCGARQSSTALQLLLSLGKWDEAMQILEQHLTEDTEHFELFLLMLRNCLQSGDYNKCTALWKFMPQNFGIFHLLDMIRQHLPKDASNEIISTDKKSCTVACFKNQLLKMLGPDPSSPSLQSSSSQTK